jgi:hypothetical protein
MSEDQQNGLWVIVAKIKPKIKHVRASVVVLTEIWLKRRVTEVACACQLL